MPPKAKGKDGKKELTIRERQAVAVFIESGGSYQAVADAGIYADRQGTYNSLRKERVVDEIRRALNSLALSPERLLAYGVEALDAMRPYCLTDAGDDVVNVPDWPTRFKFWHDLCKIAKVTIDKKQTRDAGNKFLIYMPQPLAPGQCIETKEGEGGVLIEIKGARASEAEGTDGPGDLLPSGAPAIPADCQVINEGDGPDLPPETGDCE